MSELLMLQKRELFKSTLEPVLDMMKYTVGAISEDYHEKLSTYKVQYNGVYLHLPNKTIHMLDECIGDVGEVVDNITEDDLDNVDFIFRDEKSLHDTLVRLRDYHGQLTKSVEKLHDEITSLRDKSVLENQLKLDSDISFFLIEMRITTSFILSNLKKLDILLAVAEFSYEQNKFIIYRWQD